MQRHFGINCSRLASFQSKQKESAVSLSEAGTVTCHGLCVLSMAGGGGLSASTGNEGMRRGILLSCADRLSRF